MSDSLCSACGSPLSPGGLFCPGCGAPLAQQGGSPPPLAPAAGPGAGFGVPPAQAPVFYPGHFEKRDAAIYTVLVFVTCGLWSLVWFFQMGSDLQKATGSDKPNTILDFVLMLVTCGLWGIVVMVQWPTHIDEARRLRGMPPVQDLQMVSVILGIFASPFMYTYWQTQLNKIVDGTG